MVSVTTTSPPRPLATRSATLLEPRDLIVRLSFSTEIALAEAKLNRSSVGHTHGLHSATELLLFALAEPSIFLSLTQRRTDALRQPRTRRQNRGNTVTLRGQPRNPEANRVFPPGAPPRAAFLASLIAPFWSYRQMRRHP
jgi:hypothetical protein